MGTQLLNDSPLLRKLLAQQFPFLFVDESQDTFPNVVQVLQAVEAQERGRFCLGFFGDPTQQIYQTSVGPITPDATWAKITKEENFHCPTAVLNVANHIRHDGDGLEQNRGRTKTNANGELESDRDNQNIAAGKETSVERTRRLFYVSCTRALQDLVVVFFANDVELSAQKIRATGIFSADEIRLENALLQ